MTETVKLIAILIPCFMIVFQIVGMTFLYFIPNKSIIKGLKEWWQDG